MGGMYAAHFARAGFEVELVARGERAERLRAGLTVNAEPLVASVIDIDQVQDAEPPTPPWWSGLRRSSCRS